MKKNVEYTLKDLTDGLDVTIKGDPLCKIVAILPIQKASTGHITFLSNANYRKHLTTTEASAVILGEDDLPHYQGNAIVSKNPYFTYAKIASFFSDEPKVEAHLHSTMVHGQNVEIDPSAFIAAHCVLGNNVKIAANVVIGAGCVIGDDVEIGEGSKLDANVTLYHQVKIGKRARIFSGVVIGGDGFGFANAKGIWHVVPQIGGVKVGDDVSIGTNTTIDRGALDDTVIGNGVKLDNLIQIGHNVHIGDHTIMAGCTAVAGSTIIGKHCMIGGATCFAGHLSVCDKTIITGMTAVTKSITEPGIYSSGIVGAVPNLEFRKNNARFHRLENLIERVKHLESLTKRDNT